jgi:hypothetical protein
MAKFVQIGDWAFNPEDLAEVTFREGKDVFLRWRGQLGYNSFDKLEEKYIEGFCSWWKIHADVYKAL